MYDGYWLLNVLVVEFLPFRLYDMSVKLSLSPLLSTHSVKRKSQGIKENSFFLISVGFCFRFARNIPKQRIF